MSRFKRIEHLFLSIGSMKAGTTWLYTQLKLYPEIYFTYEKEIHYFSFFESGMLLNKNARLKKLQNIALKNVGRMTLQQLNQNLRKIKWYIRYAEVKNVNDRWYVSLFKEAGDEKYCADFSNLYYSMGKTGWHHVRNVSENVRVIYTLRDPLSRLWSQYKFYMKWIGNEDGVIDEGFEKFKEKLDDYMFWVNSDYAGNYRKIRHYLADEELILHYFE